MARPKLPEQQRNAAKELVRQGVSSEEVMRRTGVSMGTTCNLRRELKLSRLPQPLHVPHVRVDVEPIHVTRTPANGTPDPTRGGVAVPSVGAEPSTVDGLGADFAALEEQEQDVQTLLAKARENEDYVAMERLTKMRIELRRGMAQLRPPPPTDPETDVANVEASRVLVARVRKMVDRRKEAAGKR